MIVFREKIYPRLVLKRCNNMVKVSYAVGDYLRKYTSNQQSIKFSIN